MPYTVTWEPPHGVLLTLTGNVSSEDFIAAVGVVHRDRRYDDLRYIIDDLSDVVTFDVDELAVENVFAGSVGAGLSNPNRMIYIVVTHQQVKDSLAKVRADYGEMLPITLFATLEDARTAWTKASENYSPTFPAARVPRNHF